MMIIRTLALALAALVAASSTRPASAQDTDEARPQPQMRGPVFQSSNTIVMKPPAPSPPQPVPQTRREARRQARQRRLAMRPVYPANTRDPIGFAPFSDRYTQRAVVVTSPPPPYSSADPR